MKSIIAEKDMQNAALILELDEPPGNSFTVNLLEGLSYWLTTANNDPSIRSIILTGRGNVFSVGGDIHQMKAGITKNDPTSYVDTVVPLINQVIIQIVEHNLPIIAAINGSAAGGGLSLALACDHILAVENAKLAMAFGKLALTPDSGSSVVFPMYFGIPNSILGISTGKIFSPHEIKSSISVISDPSLLLEEARKISFEYKKMDRWAVAKTKMLIKKSLVELLKIQLENEHKLITKSCEHAEFGIRLDQLISSL
jgi:2-(1,2-epoxy-1,2-dihydrophenyl)acetyl-CoA isomerase